MRLWKKFGKSNVRKLSLRDLHFSEHIPAAFRLFLLLFLVAPENGLSLHQQEACSPGDSCKTKITIGEGYVTGVETVEAEITVLEIVRGEKAWNMVKAADPSNKPPDAAMEYIAARIRFVFGAKGAPGELTYGVRDEQFASVSGSGRQYEHPAIAPPKPELRGRLYQGDSLEGWVALLVSIDDQKPLMSFGNNYNRVWLKLY
jgi:hypothetical protein